MSRKMMGFDTPLDQKAYIPIRDWSAVKLALWRSKGGWEIVARTAAEMVQRCVHADGCPGEEDDNEPCLQGCPDREQRMSALVVLNAARMFAPVNARRVANEPYMAPSREYYSEIIGELVAAQTEIEMLRASPPPDVTTQRAPLALPSKEP